MNPSRSTVLFKRVIASVTTLSLPFIGILIAPAAQSANAASWDPGYIISDSVFYDGHSMTSSQIADFLNQKGSKCKAGEQLCLKDYRQTTRDWPVEANLCAGYRGRANESAAEIISRTSVSCGINPKALIAILQKESSLVTRNMPSTNNYNKAMGFGCPDFAPCNIEYYGFFNQIYRAARQFKIYALNKSRYNYQAGRYNYIQFNPNKSCGGTQVFIKNQATASLYVYTPYQPNQAALANIGGTGDGCSAYGNLNFWRLFTDWFGDPRNESNFITSTSTSIVYLVVGGAKYEIPNWDTYVAFSALGNISRVSDARLNSYPTAGTLSRFIRNGASGEAYYVDQGTKYYIPSCSLIQDFGGDCAKVTNLEPGQLAALSNGARFSNVVSLIDGRNFLVSQGKKSEILNETSRIRAKIPAPSVKLSTESVSRFPYKTPVIADNSIAIGRNSDTVLWTRGKAVTIPKESIDTPAFASLQRGRLDAESISQLPAANSIPGMFSREGNGTALLTGSGLVEIDASLSGSQVLRRGELPAAIYDSFPKVRTSEGIAVTSYKTSRVYVFANGTVRWARTYQDLTNRLGKNNPSIYWVWPETLTALPPGPDVLSGGSLIQASGKPEVYLVDSNTRLVYVESPDVLNAIGQWNITQVPASALSGYVIANEPLQPLLNCSDMRAGIGWSIRRIDRRQAGPNPGTLLGSAACAKLSVQGDETIQGPLFVTSRKTSTVYLVIDGIKHPISSWSVFLKLRGKNNAPIFWLSPSVLDSLPSGTPLT